MLGMEGDGKEDRDESPSPGNLLEKQPPLPQQKHWQRMGQSCGDFPPDVDLGSSWSSSLGGTEET